MLACVFALALGFALAGCTNGGSQGAGEGPSGNAADGAAAVSTPDRHEWNIGTIYVDPAATEAYTNGLFLDVFADLVEERTEGQIAVNSYFASVMGGSTEMFDQVRRGELTGFFGQPMSSADPRFGAFSVPYTFESLEQVKELIAGPDAPLFRLAQGWMEENNAVLVCSGLAVFRGFFFEAAALIGEGFGEVGNHYSDVD
jgi:TRAP-type C4-dicarboxylate transport system substrate-binding protein